MSHPDDTDPEPVDTTDETAEIYVADPDDYAKTRKLKALNDAKSHVRQVRNDRPGLAKDKEWDGLNQRLGVAVASYGHELLPLLEAAQDAGIIGDGDFYTDGVGKDDVRVFINTDGRIESADGSGYDVPPPHRAMAIYRHLQTLERKLGLGLQLDEKQDDEWEVEV
jgi:hypothetical protein